MSGLLSCFSPPLFACELSEALDVPVRHFIVHLREKESTNGRLSVQLEINGVHSLTLGDENANRAVVSRLVQLVSQNHTDVQKLRIIEITMVKREIVSNPQTPKITDDNDQLKSTGISAAQASESIMRRLQEVDQPWFSLLGRFVHFFIIALEKKYLLFFLF